MVSPRVVAQLKAVTSPFFMAFGVGMGIGWASPGLMKLQQRNDDAPFVVNTDELSWIASLLDLGIMFGCILGGVLFGRAGRKRAMCAIPTLLVFWAVLTITAKDPTYLYAARIFSGAAVGVYLAFLAVYVVEISSTDLRGMFTTAVAVSLMLGYTLQYAAGPYLTYWAHASIGLPPPLLAFGTAFWMVESPYFLATHKRNDDARKALAKLRGTQIVSEIEDEFTVVQKALADNATSAKTFYREFLRSKGNQRGAIIVLILSGSKALTGENAVASYAQYIFNQAGTSIPEETSALLMALSQTAATVISIKLVDSVGRRPLLIYTFITAGIGMAGICLFFVLKEKMDFDVSSIPWLPLTGLAIFQLSIGLGASTLAPLLSGEMLPQQSKNFIPPISMTLVSLSAFGIAKSFPMVSEQVGMFLPFGLFALWNIFSAIFAVFFVPETKGKTLVEIQEAIRHKGGVRRA